MKIVNAVWEKRNLGISATEITVDRNDRFHTLSDAIKHIDSEYVVVKVPAGMADYLFSLGSLDFTYVESIINVTTKVKELSLSNIEKRLSDSVDYHLMQNDDIDKLFSEIRNGMYESDRIYLDPYFSHSQAAQRYIGWLSDEVDRGSSLYSLDYKDQGIGYFALKDLGDGVYYPFLAGIYSQYRTSGLGFNIITKPMEEMIKRGGKLYSTFISTNNSNAIRVHVRYGFSFNDIHYVYVRHKR